MTKKLTKEEKIEKQLAAGCARQEWLSDKIMAYLEGNNGFTAEQLYQEDNEDKFLIQVQQIADGIKVDFDEVDNAISEMFF